MVVSVEEQTNQASTRVPASSSRRETAVHVRVADILAGAYTKREGWEPNTIDLGDFHFSRVNMLGMIVSGRAAGEGLASSVLVLDDGSGQIMLRSFDARSFSAAVGDLVLVIGRPREFADERYVVPEIIRKLDNPKWVDVRKRELEILDSERLDKIDKRNAADVASGARGQQKTTSDMSDESTTIVVSEEAILDVNTQPAKSNPAERILEVIRAKDSGAGVAFEDISASCPESDVESVLRRLLESGDVFEFRAGRYRTLE